MSFKITINRPITKPRRYTVVAPPRAEALSNLKGPDLNVSLLTGGSDQQYGNQILQVLLGCCHASNTPIDTFNRIYFFVVFFPLVWFAIVSDAVSSTCRMSRYPIITIFLSEVLLLTCLARYTAVMIVVSTIIGGVVLSVRPITTGTKLLFPFVNDRLNSLENYCARHASSLRVLLEDSQMLLPTQWFEDEGCEVIQTDDLKRVSGHRPALLPPPLGIEKLNSPPLHVLPKVMYKVQSQAQKPEFDPEGWLLV